MRYGTRRRWLVVIRKLAVYDIQLRRRGEESDQNNDLVVFLSFGTRRSRMIEISASLGKSELIATAERPATDDGGRRPATFLRGFEDTVKCDFDFDVAIAKE